MGDLHSSAGTRGHARNKPTMPLWPDLFGRRRGGRKPAEWCDNRLRVSSVSGWNSPGPLATDVRGVCMAPTIGDYPECVVSSMCEYFQGCRKRNILHNRADFSGMDGNRDQYIGNVLHKAFVSVDGNGAFAFDLYHVLAGEEGNLFCSPHSISVALSMTYAGAASGTASQMWPRRCISRCLRTVFILPSIPTRWTCTPAPRPPRRGRPLS